MSPPASELQSTRILLVGPTKWVEDVADGLDTRTAATVQTEPTVDAALEAFRTGSIDAVVSEYALDEATGIDLLKSVRAETSTLPVILCTAAGSEAVASEAIAGGVTDYVPLQESAEAPFEELLDRIEQGVRGARRAATQRERARQFDAIFRDTRTATWVLDPDGGLARVNRTAREMIPADVETLVGAPFWTLPWWDAAGLPADVRRLTERARSGTFAHAVISCSASVGAPPVLDLSARPVRNERGDIVSILVRGDDISDRVELERDLRQSEALHRVTLNNMTDTVLITDDDGAYTYVCPNVHFIFGYTAEEIRSQGSIDDLLGEDLFDPAALAEEGVLKNIECTVTDKAGREHILLVNVREVSIQGGTLLYSCRDITTRKQREVALASLQETARDFLYAGTEGEIAQHIVDDTPSVLDVDASAVYRFDAAENALTPEARSAAIDRLNGPLPTIPVDSTSLPGYSFLEDESLVFEDVHAAERFQNPASDLRSAAYIPLGDHGVFVVGSPEVGRFDAVAQELADLLAATAEAALDRVRRERHLREQERELQRRNRELTALNRVNEIIREIDQALVQAETRAEIDHAVCERLATDDRFSFAWIGDVDAGSAKVEPRAWAGEEQGYLDTVAIGVDTAGTDPAGQTAASGDVTRVTNVPAELRDADWRAAAVERDFRSVVSVPLAYDDLSYGVLTVYANTQDAFDETTRAVLAELGETIASATSAIERKNALLTRSVTRFEFEIDTRTFFLSRLASDAEGELSYIGSVQRSDGGGNVFVRVEGADVERIEAVAADMLAIDEVRSISDGATGGVFRLRLSRPFLAFALADHGAVLREVTVDETGSVLTIDVPESVDDRPITSLVTESFAEAALRSKHTLDRSSTRDLYATFLDRLTARQLEVLKTAYYSGFFEAPRESTGAEVAETLGISPAAFYQHARTVERKLFTTLFDDVGVSTASAGT